MPSLIDETGNKYGLLTVLYRAENDPRNNTQWLCKCDCGNEYITRGAALRNGDTKSCGCMTAEWIRQAQTKHGMTNPDHPEYRFYIRTRPLLRKYGITPDEYKEMLKEQQDKCKICERDFDGEVNVPHVDHCHSSGKVRGLICRTCNTGLGNFEDRTDWLKKAVEYLETSHAL